MDKFETRRIRVQELIAMFCGGKQSELAKKIGASDSYVARMLYGEGRAGKKRIGEAMIDRIAWAFNVNKAWFDREPGDEETPLLNTPYGPTKLALVTSVHPDDPLDDDPKLDLVYIPESRMVEIASSGRSESFEISEEMSFAYRNSWFESRGIKPGRARRFRVSGDSMEPMLFANDTVLVDLDDTNVVDGKVYAIRYGKDLRIRYLSQRLDGTLFLRSVSPHYREEEVAPEIAAEHITIIGRVRDKCGDGGL